MDDKTIDRAAWWIIAAAVISTACLAAYKIYNGEDIRQAVYDGCITRPWLDSRPPC